MMMISLGCTHCVNAVIAERRDEIISKGYIDHDEELAPVSEINDESVYDVVCSKGHKSKVVLLNEKFELLFDLGLNALVDGYYRDAVSTFAASYERFLEFCIRVFLHDKRSQIEFDKTWNLVKSQSKRQLGAFLFLYLRTVGEMPPHVPEKWVSFRNSLVHKGRIPTQDESAEFGEVIRALVNEGIGKLKITYGERLISIYEAPLKEFHGNNVGASAYTLSTVLSVRNGPMHKAGEYRNWTLKDMKPKILEARGTTRYLRISR